ncbi:MAG: HAMP domain-containing histidine kinase [Alphaproteobacteria bacterium]|nr:HAMP domain-containing histidine kinase [Alphaproteobacteria bacterium]
MTDPVHERIRSQRILLVLVGVVLPLMGVLLWDSPVTYDSMVARLVLSSLAFGSVLASQRTTWGRENLHLLGQMVGLAVYVWFALVAVVNRVGFDDALGLVPVVAIAPVYLRTWRGFLGMMGVVAGGLLVIAVAVPDPVIPVSILALLTLAMAAGFGALSVGRARLEDRLVLANEELEARVEARTAELVAAERSAVLASRAKTVFLGNMSHELRTPLNAILGYTEMVEEALEDDELRADLGNVKSAARHLLGLIDDVLDLTRVEAQELDLRLEPVGLAAVVDEARGLLPTLGAGGVAFAVDVPDVEVLADRTRLRQVLVNLLSNAQKFTDSGSIRVHGSVDGERVRVVVEDTGVGIPADVLPRVFERFVQADGSETRRHGGTGLGLAVCRMLVDQMGGRIAAESTVGEGSRFTLFMRRPAGA